MKTELAAVAVALLLTAGLPARAAEPEPKVTVVVGHLLPSEGGPAQTPSSPLDSPFGIDFDPGGNMTIIELAGGRVHRLAPGGRLTQIAGDGSAGYGGDGGPAARATFNGMHNLAVRPSGDVFIADAWNHCIRKIDAASGVITTFAGTGTAGFSGDGGPAKEATFNFLMCVTLSPDNRRLHLADLKNLRVRVIDLETGRVDTVAGNGVQGVPPDGAVANNSPLVDPRAVAADAQGTVYILERSGHALRAVGPDGAIRTVAGTGERGYRDGPALEAQLNSPKHVCVDPAGNVYIADEGNQAIRKYDPQNRTLTTVVGRGRGNPAVELNRPHGVCFEKGTLYIVDSGNNRILRLDAAAGARD
jgi:streptogramin lyase